MSKSKKVGIVIAIAAVTLCVLAALVWCALAFDNVPVNMVASAEVLPADFELNVSYALDGVPTFPVEANRQIQRGSSIVTFDINGILQSYSYFWYKNSGGLKGIIFNTSSSTWIAAGSTGIGYSPYNGAVNSSINYTGWFEYANNGGTISWVPFSCDSITFSQDNYFTVDNVDYYMHDIMASAVSLPEVAPVCTTTLTYFYTSVGDTSGPISIEDYGFSFVHWTNVPDGEQFVSIAFYDGSTYLNTWEMPVSGLSSTILAVPLVWIMPYSMDDFTSGQPIIRYWYSSTPNAYVDDYLYGSPLSAFASALVNNRAEYDRLVSNDFWASSQYGEGYRVGYNEGYTAQNNLLNVIWSVFEFPFRITFGEWVVDENTGNGSYQNGLFTFTILGLDVRAFLLAILSICVVVAVIKFVLGNR